jgi:UV DNA damage endonuclease
MEQIIENNLACLSETLMFNREHNILFFRISSDLIPFASHPICDFAWQKLYRGTFRKIGNFIKRHKMRVSMHPDQFVLLNSLDEDIFHRSVKELLYHAEILDLLETNRSAKIQIHVGGIYGQKEKSLKRFIERYKYLPREIKKRLVIENDERLYSVEDCLCIHDNLNMPIVFDVLHFRCNNNGERMRDTLSKAFSTWSKKDGVPIVDYSSQEKGKRIGSHAHSININDFREFLKESKGLDYDIMCEIKDKENSALNALQVLNTLKYQ